MLLVLFYSVFCYFMLLLIQIIEGCSCCIQLFQNVLLCERLFKFVSKSFEVVIVFLKGLDGHIDRWL